MITMLVGLAVSGLAIVLYHVGWCVGLWLYEDECDHDWQPYSAKPGSFTETCMHCAAIREVVL